MSAFKTLAALAAATVCINAQAQGAAPQADVRRTAEPPVAERPVQFNSALRSYRGFADEPVGPWREANDTVRRIGGWQAYGRESRDALRAPTPQSPQSTGRSTPSPQGHDAHHGARK